MLDRLLETIAERTEYIAQHLLDTSYEELEHLVALREQLTVEIAANAVIPNGANTALIQQFTRHDEAIAQRMEQLKEEAAEQLRKIKSSNTQKIAYEAKSSIGGFMFDYKK